MSNKLYVGNLPNSCTDQELKTIFGKFGTVTDAKVISDRDTGASRGFAFVTMSTPDEAAKAIAGLNNTQVGGRTVVVNEARPQRETSDRPRSGGGRGGFGGGAGGGRGGFGGGRGGFGG